MWQKMSLEEFVACERAQGDEVIQVGTMYWRKARPFFYRPLLPYQEYGPEAIGPPLKARLGGYQFGVPPQQPANSRLNLLLFTDPRAYTLETLERHKRKQINQALKEFTVRPIVDSDEFKQKAHPVYLAFYERTQYSYKAERRDPAVFARWADSVYQFPKCLVLGAYQGEELQAVSISKRVEDTIVYSVVFCTPAALRLNVTSLLLHHLRTGAAAEPGINRMWVGMYKFHGRTGIDDFYFVRGCQLVSQPAVFRANPLAALCLRSFLPRQYAKLRGELDPEVAELAVTGSPAAPQPTPSV